MMPPTLLSASSTSGRAQDADMKSIISRIRHGFTFFCLCFLFLFVAPEVHADDAFDLAVSAALDRAVTASLRSRVVDDDSVGAEVMSFVRDDVAFAPDVRLVGSVRFFGPGGELTMDMDVHGRSLAAALERLENEAVARLRYDGQDILELSGDKPTVTYVWRNTLSLGVAPSDMKEGDLYRIVDAKGNPRAKVRVRRIAGIPGADGEVELDAFWRSTVQPGMELVAASPWSVSLSGTGMYISYKDGSTTRSALGFGGRMQVICALLWQPLSLHVSAGVYPLIEDAKLYYSYEMMIGLGVDLPLGSRTGSTFTLVQDGSLTASVMAGFGLVPGLGASLITNWRAGYRHQVSSSWAWGVSGGSDTRVIGISDATQSIKTVPVIEASLTYFL